MSIKQRFTAINNPLFKKVSHTVAHTLSQQLIDNNPLNQFAEQLSQKHEIAHKAVIKIHQMAHPDTSVLFVTATAQAEANYYLIWQLFKINKRQIPHIVIISTDFSQKRGFVGNLKNLLIQKPFSLGAEMISELHIPSGKEEEDVEYIKSLINDWIMTHHPSEVIFNITGGTKLISIAQDQIATLSRHYHCVYQGRNNKLTWYNHSDIDSRLEQLKIPEDINARLHGTGYIKQGGLSVLNIDSASRDCVSVLHGLMEQDFEQARSFISYLNYLCSQCHPANRQHKSKNGAKNEPPYPYTMSIDTNTADKYEAYLMALGEVNQPYFRYMADSREVVFLSEKAVKFLGGEWFEILVGYFIFLYFGQMGQEVDVQIGLKFQKDDKEEASDGNEMDVVFMQENGYLNFIECKTVKWSKQAKPTTTVNEKLQKLSSLAKVAGLNSHIYFVSLYGLTPESMKVAKEQNIRVISGKQLLNFGEALIKD